MPSKKWWSTLLHERICTYVSPLFHEENQRCSKLEMVQIQLKWVWRNALSSISGQKWSILHSTKQNTELSNFELRNRYCNSITEFDFGIWWPKYDPIKPRRAHFSLEVESNRIERISNWFFIEFIELFFSFRINRIINFRIESNEFRTNPSSEKFDSTL